MTLPALQQESQLPVIEGDTTVIVEVENAADPQVHENSHGNTGSTLSDLNAKSLLMLSVLRFSSAWGERSSTFAFYLFLVTIFPSTLLPASIYGFCVTGTGILFSSSVGTLIDKHNRLLIVRCATLGQKISSGISYALFLLCFLTPLGHGGHLSGRLIPVFVGMVLCGAVLKVSTVCLTISIERDWASTISLGHSQRLVKLNTWIRRVDLVCDLVSPLFVSGLTAGVSYSFATAFLAGMTVVSFLLEMILSGVTYRRFPELSTSRTAGAIKVDRAPAVSGTSSFSRWFFDRLDPREIIRDFQEFRKLPVFYTSLSIASIYLTVLSFDGTMLTFLKDSRRYTDPFIAGQRAACTVAGLTGTILFPIVSRKVGLVRTGSWSIWSEFMCLMPVVVSLYIGAPASKSNTPETVPAWNAALLFGGVLTFDAPALTKAMAGMALSRIGLWMFDLAQLQILQESLESNPRRNRLTSLQYTLQNMFDMAKYALTMGLASPSEFRWAGLVSTIAVFAGGILYTFGFKECIPSIAYFPDGRHIVSASHDGIIRIWDTQTGELTSPGQVPTVPSDGKAYIGCIKIAVSPDGKYIAIASIACKVRIWDVEHGRVAHVLDGPPSPRSISFSPDSSRIATEFQNVIQLWDIATGQAQGGLLKGPNTVVKAVAWSPDGTEIMSDSADGIIRTWDPTTSRSSRGPIRYQIKNHAFCVFSPDGKYVVSKKWDGRLWIRDLRNGGSTVGPLEGPSDEVSCLAVSPDSRLFVTGSKDRTARLWDVNTGKLVAGPFEHTEDVVCVTFSPGGDFFASASLDRTICIWDLPIKTSKPPVTVITAKTKSRSGSPTDSILDLPATAPAPHIESDDATAGVRLIPTEPGPRTYSFDSILDLPAVPSPHSLPPRHRTANSACTANKTEGVTPDPSSRGTQRGALSQLWANLRRRKRQDTDATKLRQPSPQAADVPTARAKLVSVVAASCTGPFLPPDSVRLTSLFVQRLAAAPDKKTASSGEQGTTSFAPPILAPSPPSDSASEVTRNTTDPNEDVWWLDYICFCMCLKSKRRS
ncbi:hypothetical protein BV22DRAFT_1198573 [Leucogyrophana mollusca]|uniref:Uncharacterized protein n=1 Tax=Leucogyrophana mollusca TaxID=85980 RepID=A0ACB8B5C0_9AGAM|nr:hypothetical protein BV22DRAFT_1198573 [Leucogyrophana mollusca]